MLSKNLNVTLPDFPGNYVNWGQLARSQQVRARLSISLSTSLSLCPYSSSPGVIKEMPQATVGIFKCLRVTMIDVVSTGERFDLPRKVELALTCVF